MKRDETRRVVRTVLQVLLAVALAIPVLVANLPIDVQETSWLVLIVGIAGGLAAAMQTPAVDRVLTELGIGRNGRHEATDDDQEDQQ